MRADLTPAQRMMVEDGLPADLILSSEERAACWKGRRLRPTSTFADPKRPTKDEDPATKQLRKELAAAEEAKKAAHFARLKQLKQETDMKKGTAKKTANKPAGASKPSARGKARIKATAASAARQSASAPSKGVRPGSKLEMVVGLLQRPDGCTTADVLAKTGWPSVSMPQQARAAGLTLRKEKKDGVTVYRAD